MFCSRESLRSALTLTVVAVGATLVTRELLDVLSGAGIAFAMAGVVDANAWAEKMLRKVSQSAQDWENGVKNPSTSPTAAMKKAKGRFKDAVSKALADDTWGKAIDRLTDDQIIQGAIAAGGSRFVQGITSREAKVRAAIGQLQPKVAALKAKLDAMPIDNDGQREQKMLEAKRGMVAIGRELAGLSR